MEMSVFPMTRMFKRPHPWGAAPGTGGDSPERGTLGEGAGPRDTRCHLSTWPSALQPVSLQPAAVSGVAEPGVEDTPTTRSLKISS